MKIRGTDAVTEVVHERGGVLYVWTSSHRCCAGPLTLLETGMAEPTGEGRRFRPVDAGDYTLMLDTGGRPAPDELVLEVRGRRKKVVAFWNDQGWVG